MPCFGIILAPKQAKPKILGIIAGRVVSAGLRLRQTLICQFRGDSGPQLSSLQAKLMLHPKTQFSSPLTERTLIANLRSSFYPLTERSLFSNPSYSILFVPSLKFNTLSPLQLLSAMHTKEKLFSLLFIKISLHRKLFPEKIIHHGSIQFLLRDEDFISQRKEQLSF